MRNSIAFSLFFLFFTCFLRQIFHMKFCVSYGILRHIPACVLRVFQGTKKEPDSGESGFLKSFDRKITSCYDGCS